MATRFNSIKNENMSMETTCLLQLEPFLMVTVIDRDYPFFLIKNYGNLPLPFFGGNYPIFSWMTFIIDCICILTGSTE